VAWVVPEDAWYVIPVEAFAPEEFVAVSAGRACGAA